MPNETKISDVETYKSKLENIQKKKWPQKMTKEVSQSHLRSICYHLRHLEIIFTFNASKFS